MQTNNKLREACANIAEYARSAMCHTTDAHVLGYLNQIEWWAKVALAEPVRNCDVGTVEEQSARFRKFCKKDSMDNFEATAYCAYECPCGNSYDCKLAWAQMPYESEATDGE